MATIIPYRIFDKLRRHQPLTKRDLMLLTPREPLPPLTAVFAQALLVITTAAIAITAICMRAMGVL